MCFILLISVDPPKSHNLPAGLGPAYVIPLWSSSIPTTSQFRFRASQPLHWWRPDIPVFCRIVFHDPFLVFRIPLWPTLTSTTHFLYSAFHFGPLRLP